MKIKCLATLEIIVNINKNESFLERIQELNFGNLNQEINAKNLIDYNLQDIDEETIYEMNEDGTLGKLIQDVQ